MKSREQTAIEALIDIIAFHVNMHAVIRAQDRFHDVREKCDRAIELSDKALADALKIYEVSTPPAQGSIDAGGLPPLPEPDHALDGGAQPFYNPDQMRAYALADRAARQSAAPGDGKTVAYALFADNRYPRIWFGDYSSATSWALVHGFAPADLVPLIAAPAPSEPVAKVMQAIMDAPKNIAARATLTPKGNMAPSEPVPKQWTVGGLVVQSAAERDDAVEFYKARGMNVTPKAVSAEPVPRQLADKLRSTAPEDFAKPVPQGVSEVVFVPVAVRQSDFARGRHPNDKTANDPDCQEALDDRGDDSDKGLDPYWKWGFRAGWQAAQPTATNAKSGGEAAAQVSADSARPGIFRIDPLVSLTRLPAGTKLYLAPPPLPATDAASVRNFVETWPTPGCEGPIEKARNLALEEAAYICDTRTAAIFGDRYRQCAAECASDIRALISKETA